MVYDYETKLKLSKKIEKVKSKDILIQIFNIIYKDNNEYTENNNGLFLLFNNLSDTTYHKIDQIIKGYNKQLRNSDSTSDQYSPENAKQYISYYNDESYDSFSSNKSDHKLKFSNEEKNLTRRKLYNNIIDINNEICVQFDNS